MFQLSISTSAIRRGAGRLALLTTVWLLIASLTLPPLLVPGVVRAAVTYYVDAGQSIQAAIDAASPGDTIVVGAGQYAANLVINKSLTLRSAQGPETTWLLTPNANANVIEVRASNVVIEGFAILGASGLYASGILAAAWANVHSSLFTGNYMGNNWFGVSLESSSDSNIVSANFFEENQVGVYIHSAASNTVVDNIFRSNAFGIYTDYAANNNSITRNDLYANSYGFFVPSGAGNHIYLNNVYNVYGYQVNMGGGATWNSPAPLTYSYLGYTYSGFLGNYWDNYSGFDTNDDGVGESPASVDLYGASDVYPLMAPFENYLLGSRPSQPINLSPANGATGIGETVTLQSSPFSDIDAGDTHAASQWQVTTTSGDYASPAFDSGTDAVNKTNITIPSGVLNLPTTYYWRVRHQDSNGLWSDWSAETSFSTLGGLAETPWPMFHHDLQHTGRSPYTGPSTAILKWSHTTGSSVVSSPAIGADGTVYVGSEDNKLYAINADGTLKWSYTTGRAVPSSPAIGADGTVYVGSWDNKLYAINPAGTLKWSYATEDRIYSSPAIGADGTVYVGSYDNKLYAINPAGTLKWSYTTGSWVRSSPAIGADGTVYVGSYDNKLYAINPVGTLKWSYTTGGYINSSPAIGADGAVYVGSDDNKLYAINPAGTLKWSYSTGNYIHSSPAIGADGAVYVGSLDSKLYAINPAGTLKWSYATGGGISSSPAIGADGTVYVGSNDNKLYAIGEDRPPAMPSNTSPDNGATGVSLTPTLTSSAFSDPDAGDAHAASQWQVTTTSGDYASPSYDSGTDTANLTSIAIPSGRLVYSTTYYWRVRHQDSNGAWSAWSAETSFTTIPGTTTHVWNLPAGWSMISLPVTPENPDPNAVFGALGYFILYTWDSVAHAYVQPATLQPGVAYWILLLAPASVTIAGAPVEGYTASLPQGWGMIGAVGTALDLEQVHVDPAGALFRYVYGWDPVNNRYYVTDVLEPGAGYWALALEGLTLTVAPPPPPV